MQGPLTILIVDDTAEDRAAFMRYLQLPEHPYAFVEAETGDAGLAICETQPPDCVLLDNNLPDMDGISFLAALAAAPGPRPFPVIMTTGTGDEEVAVAALKRGAHDYISKHRLDAFALQRAVRNAIEKVALQREVLRHQEQSTRILESITDAFISLDHEWRLTYLNRAAERVLRRRRDAVLGRSLWAEFPSARDAVWFTQLQRAISTQTSVNFMAPLHDEPRWFDVRAYPAEIGLSVYLRDVTGEQRAEQILIESEVRFRSTFDQVAVGMAHVAPDGRWLRVNRRLCEIVGYTQSELLGLTFQAITHPDDVANDVEHARQVLSGELATYSIEKRYCRKDGSLVWINLTVALVRDTAGTPLYFISVVEDINDRKAATAKLLQREHEAAFLAQAGAALVRSLEPQATATTIVQLAAGALADYAVLDVVDASGAIARIAAAHADPQQAPLMAQILAFPPTPDPQSPLRASLTAGQPVLVATITEELIDQLAASAAYRALLRQLGPRSGLVVPLIAHGQLIGALTLIRVEHRPYTEADLPLASEFARRAALAFDNARLYADAQEAISIRETFLTVAAHELRTPLTTLSGTLELLRRRVAKDADLQARLDRSLQIMSQQTQRLKTLTNTMLDSVEQASDDLDGARAIVNLVDVTSAAIAEIAPGVYQHAIEFQPGAPVLVSADRNRLGQAIQHLLSNAVKFSPRGGAVEVTVERRGESGVLVVADHGMGVPTAALPRIFERFYRGPNINPLEISGFGIGLYVARQIVELHGGTIAAESAEGVGSRFKVTLPLAAEPAAAEDIPAS